MFLKLFCFLWIVLFLTNISTYNADITFSQSSDSDSYLRHSFTQNDDHGYGGYGGAEYTNNNDNNNHDHRTNNQSSIGLTPPVGNLATIAQVTVNGTCGELEAETFCKLVEHVHSRSRPSQCDICDSRSHDRNKRHPIEYATDGSALWWQSPSLQYGRKYEWITIAINLKQVYQVAYIVIKAANSPRPGNWILERSLDGQTYTPWQYYAISDEECWTRYGILATPDKPSYKADDEVICTSYYSKITPFEGGEIHTSLVNGRPGASGPSETLIKFTMAQYIRLRFQKIRTLYADLVHEGTWDRTVMRRYFYSIKDIAIGGHCVCFGHSNECLPDLETGAEKCMCKHNTCGSRCESCCPLFNQYRWAVGNSTSSSTCEPCQCFNRANSCYYDENVASAKKSVNTFGIYEGGGVCVDCKEFTTGINCEKCIEGFYHPNYISIAEPNPCRPCDCNSIGTIGHCFSDRDPITPETKHLNYGDCRCKEGFGGKKCDMCAFGYHGFPNCQRCPCNMAGVVDNGCEGQCICKPNVEGIFCSSCKAGYYNLDWNNPNGCTQCFCNGLTDQCVSSNASIIRVENDDIWYVSDLHGTKILPVQKLGDGFHISNEEFNGYGLYFWYGNNSFAGYHLDSYGLKLVFHVGWIQARGDTSGRMIQEFDVIIRGRNSILAFSNSMHEGNNASIAVVLNEIQCTVMPDMDNHIIQKDILQNGNPCTRHDVMEVLYEVKSILIRAKYRTDQLEGTLHDVYLEKARLGTEETLDDSNSNKTYGIARSIELCTCPEGYIGPSCEECAYGYRELHTDTWLKRCFKCDCNGHAKTCEVDGTCSPFCEHNTTGDHCEQCLDGFYGNPSTGLINACKHCECPLGISSNNFSPTCVLDGNNYKCNACQVGYEGNFCERCSNGYFGDPTKPGEICKPCDCNHVTVTSTKNICDHLTGECLICAENTMGFKCEECIQGFYGNPLNGTCKPCNCNKYGSVGLDCHPENGQCICADNFEGKTCDRCIEGHGGLEEDCPPCNCDPRGSESLICNPTNGQCVCKPGVGGRYCNRCLDLYYNFSADGCKPCECDINGSDSPICNLMTGQCNCLPHVKGQKCDKCEVGYWNIISSVGCTNKCECSTHGSESNYCDGFSGQCICKVGVAGRCCDKCSNNFFGFSTYGCKPCDPCAKSGHVCDKKTGRCTCPPNTEGEACDKCQIGFWGLTFEEGCKECNCSKLGSISQQCSPITGKCTCKEGFEGDGCNKCKFGYYNYPKCIPCLCDSAGTIQSYCNDKGICSCDEGGQCRCKENVNGQKCNRCVAGTYGLTKSNPEGCQECFCFRRTNKCSQGYFLWERFGMLNSRTLTTTAPRKSSRGPLRQFNPYNEGEEQCFIYLALPSERRIEPLWNSKFQLKLINNLIVIPENANDVLIESEISFGAPLYWQLPQIFTGDKVLSYGGYLRFRVISEGGNTVFPFQVLESYPLVQIQGNYKLILEHFIQRETPTGYYEIKLHEDFWQLKNFNSPLGTGVVTKEIMMVALQNLQSILIRGTSRPEIHSARLFNVSLDIAVPTSQNTHTAFGIEICDCPAEYNSTSCQNPKLGYYRWYKNEYITSTVIIDLVGEAKPCECNGRSVVCDTETGNCMNCSSNTGGVHCEECASGYYGTPTDADGCLPCSCPTTRSNHATTCYQLSIPGQFQCRCHLGYAGRNCDRCEVGYYGNPYTGKCIPCQCNDFGSINKNCDQKTGQCKCHQGISGRDCTKCSYRHILIGKKCTSCLDQCAGVLLETVDEISETLKSFKTTINDTDISIRAVWFKLNYLDGQWKEFNNIFTGFNILTNKIIIDNFKNLYIMNLMPVVDKQCNNNNSIQSPVGVNNFKAIQLVDTIGNIKESMQDSILTLNNFIKGKTKPNLNNISIEVEIRSILKDIIRNSDDKSKVDFTMLMHKVKQEHEEAIKILQFIMNYVWNFDDVKESLENQRERLDDLRHFMEIGKQNQAQADGILYTANEHYLGIQANIEEIQHAMTELVRINKESDEKLNQGTNSIQEMNQVYMMIEDILKDVRNWTKEVEIRENELFELVPLYRVKYAQPAFDHVKYLQHKSSNLQGLIHLASFNASESLHKLGQLNKLHTLVTDSDVLVEKTTRVGEDTRNLIHKFLGKDELSFLEQDSLGLINDAQIELEIVKTSLQNNIDICKESVQNAQININVIKSSIEMIQQALDKLNEDQKIDDILEPIKIAQKLLDEILMQAMEIDTELKTRVLGTPLSGSFSAEGIRTIEQEIQFNLKKILTKIVQVKSSYEFLQRKHETGDQNLKYLKALILQSRHRADSVPVSLGPDETGICFRLFKVAGQPVMTTIKFNFAPIRPSDSLLLFWPSSINEDFISVEMVNLQIKVSWNLGTGLHTIIYPKKLIPDLESESSSPDSWVEISIERIGSSVSVYVDAPYGGQSDPLAYQGADEESTLLDLAPTDFIHIGGFSKEKRPGLVSNGLSGCIYNLQVNGKRIGLWNFVGNEGCAPCIECSPTEDQLLQPFSSDYYFDGKKSYATIARLRSQTFNSKYIEISIEFQTYSENALLFLTVNDEIGQSLCLELVEGQILFTVEHQRNDTINRITVESNQKKLNVGKWIQVNTIWVFQFGAQTVQLTIDKNERYTQEKKSSQNLALQLLSAEYNIGGISPTFETQINGWSHFNTKPTFRGCMKNVLIDGTTYDLTSGQHNGIESGCKGRNTYSMSFAGNGFAEYQTQMLEAKDVHFGFSFRTTYPSGILMMLLAMQDKSTEISIQPYLIVYLENGQILVQIGTLIDSMIIGNQTSESSNELDVIEDGIRYDDGQMHAFRLSRKNRKLKIYMDDELVQEDRIPKKFPTVITPAINYRLFFGGINLDHEQYLLVENQIPKNRFHGCLEHFFIGNELFSFNRPISAQNQILGPCPSSDINGGVHSYGRFKKPAGDLLKSLEEDGNGTSTVCSTQYDEDGIQFDSSKENSYGIITLQANALKQKFNLTFSLKTSNENGVFIYGMSKIPKSNGGTSSSSISSSAAAATASCILIYLNNGILNMKLYGNRPQELICSTLNPLSDGNWHQVSVIKSENKIYIFLDSKFQTNCEYLTTKIKSIHKLYIGGIPSELMADNLVSTCLNNFDEDTKPLPLDGCMRNVIINSFQYNFKSPTVQLYQVQPCVEKNTNLVLNASSSASARTTTLTNNNNNAC